MFAYFAGWRRKSRLLTLMAALILMSAWQRSYSQRDLLHVGTPLLRSADGELALLREFSVMPKGSAMSDEIDLTAGVMTKSMIQEHGLRERYHEWEAYHVKWRWDLAGFHFGASTNGVRDFEIYEIPFWSIVMPITLFSAWLLLSRQRTAHKRARSVSTVSMAA